MRRQRLAPSVFFSSRSCLNVANATMLSMTPHLPTFSMKGIGSTHLEPKLDAFSVSVSFVYNACTVLGLMYLTGTEYQIYRVAAPGYRDIRPEACPKGAVHG